MAPGIPATAKPSPAPTKLVLISFFVSVSNSNSNSSSIKSQYNIFKTSVNIFSKKNTKKKKGHYKYLGMH